MSHFAIEHTAYIWLTRLPKSASSSKFLFTNNQREKYAAGGSSGATTTQAWRKNNNQTLLAKNFTRVIESELHVEMPTKAFCKMYEILCEYESALGLSVHGNTLNSAHLCEAPGTFVSAMNHFLRSRYPAVHWDWVASTLANSEIGEDYSLLHKYVYIQYIYIYIHIYT